MLNDVHWLGLELVLLSMFRLLKWLSKVGKVICDGVVDKGDTYMIRRITNSTFLDAAATCIPENLQKSIRDLRPHRPRRTQSNCWQTITTHTKQRTVHPKPLIKYNTQFAHDQQAKRFCYRALLSLSLDICDYDQAFVDVCVGSAFSFPRRPHPHSINNIHLLRIRSALTQRSD